MRSPSELVMVVGVRGRRRGRRRVMTRSVHVHLHAVVPRGSVRFPVSHSGRLPLPAPVRVPEPARPVVVCISELRPVARPVQLPLPRPLPPVHVPGHQRVALTPSLAFQSQNRSRSRDGNRAFHARMRGLRRRQRQRWRGWRRRRRQGQSGGQRGQRYGGHDAFRVRSAPGPE